ncbi:unnamed protein product [Urochloa decumbens]|uniref:HhH-GPD domain-containing protein n=1 Tax=Urochloa decumbens TaxID=240449 RepID=A0ABC8XHU1_9POAL
MLAGTDALPSTADMDMRSPPNVDVLPPVASADDDDVTPPPATTTPEFTPSSTWRKKPSQKGKPRLKLVKHAKTTSPKPPIAPPHKKRKPGDGGGGGGETPNNKPAVRRKLDLDGDSRPTNKISTPAVIVSGCFRRATLMDNLKSLAKLNLMSKKPPRTPPAPSPAKINKPAPAAPAPKKIDLRSFGRAQLMENLRSLAKRHNLPAVAAAAFAGGEVHGANGKEAKKKKPTYVDELVLVPYTRKRAAAAAGGEDPFRALVLHDELAGALVLRWKGVELAARPRPRARLVRGITPAIEAAHGELMRQEETCRGEDLGDIPDSPELEEKRKVLEARVQHFMTLARLIMGDRKFDHPWKGTVVTSVVGTFLTQNVTDHMSSNAFMNLAAEFPLSKNYGSNVKQSTNVPLLTDGCGLVESEPGDHGPADEQSKCHDKGIDELIASIRAGEISNWDRGRIRKVLHDRFEPSTARKIFYDIASIGDTSHWNSLLKEAYNNGYRKGDTDETIDWEALLHAPFAKIEECIRDRGNQSQMALRILAFLIRIKRDHGSIDLEWLRYVPRAKARRYLRSINGLGAKSVDCIRLLSLRHRAFPVDTNVARIVTRLGWVELQPLADSQEFHLVNTYPVMADIQKYLEPLLCNIPADEVYELHCQQITFGKSICTKRRPNCGACPFTAECKYFQSLVSRAKGALPEYSQQGERRQTNMDGTPRHTLIIRPDHEQVHQYQIEMGKGTERHFSEPIVEMPKTPPCEDLGAQIEMEKGTERYCCEPIIEMPKTPPREDLGSQSDEEFEEEYDDDEQEEDIEDIEDVGYDEMIDLRPMQQTENAPKEPTNGKEIISIQPRISSTPMIKRYRLRTEYTAYKIPDGHEILDRFDPRVPGDHIQYLLIIRSLLDEHSVTATILIPCRTANGGVFPLNGTYYQHNEVFVDHSSSRSPIKIKRKSIDIYSQCTVYFGASIHSVTRGQTQEGIYQFYHKGYICNREFDRTTRRAKDLSTQIHATNVKGTSRKRFMTSSSPG